VAFANALCTDSVLDLETVVCFLALHETKLDPKYIAYPPVDLLSSKQPAQSASEYPLTNIELDLHILTPILVQPLRYLKICFTTIRCKVVGE
jgi:hypothetical protein